MTATAECRQSLRGNGGFNDSLLASSELEGNGSWYNLRYYPRICLEELRKTTKSQDIVSPG
jgi:hypothetical protein